MSGNDSTSDITDGTYRALCEHGYADVTMADIAAETDRSKSALHYHYDSKHDLLLAFFDDLLERFVDRLEAVEGDTARERLRALVRTVLHPPAEADADRRFQTAVLELKAQSPYDDDFRAHLLEYDRTLREHLREHLAAGVEAGEFRADLDVEVAADFFVTVFTGAQTRSVSVGRSVEETEATLERYVETMVVDSGASR
jgi:AcrR family transcriptional regulator